MKANDEWYCQPYTSTGTVITLLNNNIIAPYEAYSTNVFKRTKQVCIYCGRDKIETQISCTGCGAYRWKDEEIN